MAKGLSEDNEKLELGINNTGIHIKHSIAKMQYKKKHRMHSFQNFSLEFILICLNKTLHFQEEWGESLPSVHEYF